jgi:hypothetical protein
MKKSATLISTALLTFGLAAASMAADVPKSGTPAADSSAPAPSAKSHKHSSKKHKKATTTASSATK